MSSLITQDHQIESETSGEWSPLLNTKVRLASSPPEDPGRLADGQPLREIEVFEPASSMPATLSEDRPTHGTLTLSLDSNVIASDSEPFCQTANYANDLYGRLHDWWGEAVQKLSDGSS